MNKKILKRELISFTRTFFATFVVDYGFILTDVYNGDFSDLTLHAVGIALFRTCLKTLGIYVQPYLTSFINKK